MKNPRFYFRIDGRIPPDHPLLGYRIPFKYDLIIELINRFTKDIEWSTIQITITPSLLTSDTKVLYVSAVYKHVDVPLEHMAMMFEDRTRRLIASASTLEEIFDLFDERAELKE